VTYHNPLESTRPDDLVAGTNVLLYVVKSLAQK
jgi:acetylornithine deacetylase/succinyl-diaminopimelate desuccinylase-like protein